MNSKALPVFAAISPPACRKDLFTFPSSRSTHASIMDERQAMNLLVLPPVTHRPQVAMIHLGGTLAQMRKPQVMKGLL